jgi:hypothetical protein
MAKFVNDAVMDAALNHIKNSVDKLILCVGQPTTYAEATTALGTGSGKKVGEIAFSSAQVTLANGDTSGRKATFSAMTDIDIDLNGTVDHVALVDDTGSVLLLVTTCAAQAVTAGNIANTAAFDEEIADAA